MLTEFELIALNCTGRREGSNTWRPIYDPMSDPTSVVCAITLVLAFKSPAMFHCSLLYAYWCKTR